MSRKTEILQSIIDVWCRDQDIDAVLTHLSDDLVWHYSAISQPPKHGKAGAREFLEAYKAKVRNPHWRIFRIAETEDALPVGEHIYLAIVHPTLSKPRLLHVPQLGAEIQWLIEDQVSRGLAFCSAVPGAEAPFAIP